MLYFEFKINQVMHRPILTLCTGSQRMQSHITPHTELESHHQPTPAVKKLTTGSIHTLNKGLISYSVPKTILPAAELHVSVNISQRSLIYLTGMPRAKPVTLQCCIDLYETTMRAIGQSELCVCDLHVYYQWVSWWWNVDIVTHSGSFIIHRGFWTVIPSVVSNVSQISRFY